jgi:imidazolonepropionase-like amidohydrolase
MKKFATYLLCGLMSAGIANAQETVYPAKPQSQPIIISNGTIHVGNGQVINNGSVLIENGKISAVGASVNAPANAVKVDASGKHVYPSLILSQSDL